MSSEKTIPLRQLAIADSLRVSSLEERRQPTLPEVKTNALHGVVRNKSETVPSAAAFIVVFTEHNK